MMKVLFISFFCFYTSIVLAAYGSCRKCYCRKFEKDIDKSYASGDKWICRCGDEFGDHYDTTVSFSGNANMNNQWQIPKKKNFFDDSANVFCLILAIIGVIVCAATGNPVPLGALIPFLLRMFKSC